MAKVTSKLDLTARIFTPVPALVDTNILVCAFDNVSTRKQRTASELLLHGGT